MTLNKNRSLFVILSLGAVVLAMSNCASIDTSGANIDALRAAQKVEQGKWPIVYSPAYNISFGGIERVHAFDTHKYGRIFSALSDKGILTDQNYYTPQRPAASVLTRHHSDAYLEGLQSSKTVAQFTEISALKWLPNRVSYNAVVEPAKLATSGSIIAGGLALKHGWAINLGGGYHHASKDQHGGFCAIADISLSILHLTDSNAEIENVMIIDLDAHQGNGHARDFMDNDAVFTLDVYNASIYPRDTFAKQGVDLSVELPSYTKDADYLSKVGDAISEAFKAFKPDVIYYIAGTDILEGDTLGQLSISPEGILKRDQLVFGHARANNVPIVMLLAGGYQKNNAEIIAESIEQLISKFELKPTD